MCLLSSMLHCLMMLTTGLLISFRLLSLDDLAAGLATVYVPAASAQPDSPNAPRVYSAPDSAVVLLGGGVSMLDISVAAVPLVIHQHGECSGTCTCCAECGLQCWVSHPTLHALLESLQAACQSRQIVSLPV
jgi:hypothetical protein